MRLNVVILLGSVRSDRKGFRVARFVERRLTERGHSVTLVDPQAVQLPLLDRMYKEFPKGSAPETLERLATLYRSADAFVVVSAEYNHSIPPALSNLLDHFLEEYFWRPSAIVCYSGGAFGGVRAAMQLRAMLCELGMPSISSLFPCRTPTSRSTRRVSRPMRRPTVDSRVSQTNSSGTRKRCAVSAREAYRTRRRVPFAGASPDWCPATDERATASSDNRLQHHPIAVVATSLRRRNGGSP